MGYAANNWANVCDDPIGDCPLLSLMSGFGISIGSSELLPNL
jgi:hypothetical protein